MKEKERLDVLLTERGFFESREKAKAAVMAGLVFVKDRRVDKAGTKIEIHEEITVKGNPLPYVGRGGLKLEKALQMFPLDLKGKSMIDIGASTGGFTDCALQNGAVKVVAIDVGYGQLAWKLRTDERVVNMERTNIRGVTPEDIGGPVDFIYVYVLLKTGGQIVTLIKPQFEAGREAVGKGGIVRDMNVHRETVSRVVAGIAQAGLSPLELTYSPIKGADGNVEYLLYSRKDEPIHNDVTDEEIGFVVARSHEM